MSHGHGIPFSQPAPHLFFLLQGSGALNVIWCLNIGLTLCKSHIPPPSLQESAQLKGNADALSLSLDLQPPSNNSHTLNAMIEAKVRVALEAIMSSGVNCHNSVLSHLTPATTTTAGHVLTLKVPYFTATVFPPTVWESIGKWAHMQLVRKCSATVVSACWATVDWPWHKRME